MCDDAINVGKEIIPLKNQDDSHVLHLCRKLEIIKTITEIQLKGDYLIVYMFMCTYFDTIYTILLYISFR